MDSIRISIEASEDDQEILISQLSDLGAEGFEQTDRNLLAYFPAHTFKSYEVNELLKAFNFRSDIIEDRNWNEVWESNFQPVTVDDFCAIRAEFHKPVPNVTHEILITPKMSFGTGHHATTYMMVSQMKDIDFREKTVFDFGTGTGILAILAEKLGAERVVATDIDDWSIVNARENCQRNNCSKIELLKSSSIPAGLFDVILANINRNVILEYLPKLKKALSPDGYILFSGLLESDEIAIVESCKQQGLFLLKSDERNKWISLLFNGSGSSNL